MQGLALPGLHVHTRLSQRRQGQVPRPRKPEQPRPGAWRQRRSSCRASGLGSASQEAPAVTAFLGRLLGSSAAPAASRVLALLLSTPTVPIGSYVAVPSGPLHGLDPRVKQAWLLAVLLLPGKLVLPGKLAVAAALAALSAISLPRRVWTQQLATLTALCALLFVFTALGADSVPPLTQPRLPPASLESLPGLPRGGYSYVLLQLGPLCVTRRGCAFGAAAASLTFTLLQSARLLLCTTPPEALAGGLAWAAQPLRVLHPQMRCLVDECVLTLLLALRFCALVFEEARNLALALAVRGVDWAALGSGGALEVALQLFARLMGNLFATAAQIAEAMQARGYREPGQAAAALQYAAPLRLRLRDWVALVALGLLLAGVCSGAGVRAH